MDLKPSKTENLTTGTVVEYQQNSKSLLGIIIGLNKDKFEIFNETGNNLFLPSNRLFRLGKAKELNTAAERLTWLKELTQSAQAAFLEIQLESAWEMFAEAGKTVAEQEIAELFFSELDLVKKLAVHRVLLEDKIFFKRDKTGVWFEPRSSSIIEELKKKQANELLRKQAQERLVVAIVSILNGKKNIKLPDEIGILEQYAASGSKAFDYKTALSVLDEIVQRAKIVLTGRGEERAFNLLVKIGHFSRDENLALYKVGRYTKFDLELEDSAAQLVKTYAEHFVQEEFEDLTELNIFSIDGIETKDIDDALSLEKLTQGWRIGIHITDVADLVKPNTDLFEESLFRASSLYFPEQKVHMLPQQLSEKACSLVNNQVRFAMTFFLYLDNEDKIVRREILRSKIMVKQRLDYETVDEALSKPPACELDNLLHKLYDFTLKLEQARLNTGAVVFQRNEMLPVLLADGKIGLEQNNDNTPARKLVSELMVLANYTAASFAKDNNLAIIYRSQAEPDTDPKSLALDVPEGVARNFLQCIVMKKSITGTEPLKHYSLGVDVYTQITSPIRRAVDLINQKQIISFLREKRGFFSVETLQKLANKTDESLQEARTLQKERNRYWLLRYIIQEGWTELEGTVLRNVGVKNPLVELDSLSLIWSFEPLESKRVRGVILNKPGDRVSLKIKKINPDDLVMRLAEVRNYNE
ncbi:MAG: RNB domain-containing ribonuclease [Deltaproteobacteria bacterium]|jgi:exoribonuclease-2|nr:RNB domain-containing ribonuclease [Deltaproteobacteria bacterium]